MLNGRVDALADWFRAELSPSHLETYAPIPARTVLDAPADAIARTGERIDAFLAAAREADPGACLVGVGRSFGGYMLLKAASERPSRLDAFSLLVPIEAPLSPSVNVQIPPLLPILLPAARHYRERPAHAASMLGSLGERARCKVLTLGAAHDSVIPAESHRLPGANVVVVQGAGVTLPAGLSDRAESLHVVLPAFPPGFALETALLPVSYRTHLTWSEAKHRLVNRLIVAACPAAWAVSGRIE